MFANKKNIIFILALFVIVTAVTLIRGGSSDTSNYDYGETEFTVSANSEYSFSIKYTDIDSVTLVEVEDWGECLSGEAGKKTSYGEFRNDQFGSYSLSALTKVSTCICITDTSGHNYVFNFENASTTREFYNTLTEELANKQRLNRAQYIP